MKVYLAIRQLNIEERDVLGVFTSIDKMIEVLQTKYKVKAIVKIRDGEWGATISLDDAIEWYVNIYEIDLDSLVEI